jgi:hypothetical protein
MLAVVPGKDTKIMAKNEKEKAGHGVALGFEATLWATADKLEKAIRQNLEGLGYGF